MLDSENANTPAPALRNNLGSLIIATILSYYDPASNQAGHKINSRSNTPNPAIHRNVYR